MSLLLFVSRDRVVSEKSCLSSLLSAHFHLRISSLQGSSLIEPAGRCRILGTLVRTQDTHVLLQDTHSFRSLCAHFHTTKPLQKLTTCDLSKFQSRRTSDGFPIWHQARVRVPYARHGGFDGQRGDERVRERLYVARGAGGWVFWNVSRPYLF